MKFWAKVWWIIAICGLLYSVYVIVDLVTTRIKCEQQGGVYVRAAFAYECIEVQRIILE